MKSKTPQPLEPPMTSSHAPASSVGTAGKSVEKPALVGRILRFIAPFFVLLVFIAIASQLLATKPVATRTPTFAVPPLVAVTVAKTADLPRQVQGMGSIIPAQRVVVHPEVSGKVVSMTPELVPGGLVSAGDLLLSIDPRDYELAIVQAKAKLAQARFQWKVEQGRKRVAEREWSLLNDAIISTAQGRALALRQPHLASARAAVKAAKSGLERATLALERTQLTSPFNAIVQSEMVDMGQVVSPASAAAVLIGTDVFWAQISIPVNHLTHIRVGGESGSPVVLKQSTSGEALIRTGRVIRALGDLDPKGRMARVVVAIQDPLGLHSQAPAIRLGAYLEASITADDLAGVVAISRASLRSTDQIWVATDQNTLQTIDVKVAWRDRDQVYVHGVSDGMRVITSDLAAPVNGMELQVDQPRRPDDSQQKGTP